MFAWIMDAGFRGRNHGSGETPISIQGEIFLRLRVMGSETRVLAKTRKNAVQKRFHISVSGRHRFSGKPESSENMRFRLLSQTNQTIMSSESFWTNASSVVNRLYVGMYRLSVRPNEFERGMPSFVESIPFRSIFTGVPIFPNTSL